MNLLPNTEKEILKKGLKLRFTVVALFLLLSAFLVGVVTLLPSYFLTSGYFAKTDQKTDSLKAKNEKDIEKILNLPNEVDFKLKLLQSNVASLSLIDVFNKITSRVPEKVAINSVSFSRDQNYKGKKGIVVLFSGTAANRDSLVSFSTSLKESEEFSSVDVPVSSLTRDKNLPFSVSIFIEN